MGKFIDLTGQVFGRLTVICKVEKDKQRGSHVLWECLCSCGKRTVTNGKNMRRGLTQSCGCLNTDHAKLHHFIHGASHTRLHNIWCHMIRRCTSDKSADYKDYGGRGISVCDEWRQFIHFSEWAKANGYHDELSIERDNVNGNYSPDNCRWIPMGKQALNRRTSHLVTAFGECKTIAEWARDARCSVSYDTLEARIRLKKGRMPIEVMLTKPAQNDGKRV